MKKRILGIASAVMLAATSVSALPINAADYQSRGTCSDKYGYDYEAWNQNGAGQITWTGDKDPGGAFTCSWSSTQNNLFRKGKRQPRRTVTYKQMGTITIDYGVKYHPRGNSYMCCYGWVDDCKGQYPTVEYYIVEGWGSWRPPGNAGSMGTVTSDGKNYDIYRTVRTNQPSINGTETFFQYWSVRKQNENPARDNQEVDIKSTITVSNHFAAWEKAGMDMSGTMYEVSLNVEGYQSNGSANVYTNVLNYEGFNGGQRPEWAGGGGGDIDIPQDSVKYTKPSGSGTGISDDFEGSGTNWKTRGASDYGITSDMAHGGKNSLYVTGRSEAWHGLECSGGSELVAGNTYNISAYCSYKNEQYKNLSYTIGLMYKGSGGGSTSYDDIVTVEGSSEKWAELGKDFTVPAGATDIALYIQTKYTETPAASDLLSFFVDDVKLTPVIADSTTTTTTTTTTSSSSEGGNKAKLAGDVDCNGKVQIADAVLLARYIAEDSVNVSADGLANAELTNNSKLTSEDLAALLQLIAGM